MKKHVDVRKILKQVGPLRCSKINQEADTMIEWRDAKAEQRPYVVLMTDGKEVFLGYYDDDLGEWISCCGEDEYEGITHFAEINLPVKQEL